MDSEWMDCFFAVRVTKTELVAEAYHPDAHTSTLDLSIPLNEVTL